MSAQEHPTRESDIAGGKSSEPSQAAEMSAGEKVAAQWEARHDVAARGGRLDPLAVQHYLSHSRTEEMQQRTGPAGGRQHGSPPATAPVPGGPAHRGAEGTSSGEDPRGQRRRRGRLLWWRRR